MLRLSKTNKSLKQNRESNSKDYMTEAGNKNGHPGPKGHKQVSKRPKRQARKVDKNLEHYSWDSSKCRNTLRERLAG